MTADPSSPLRIGPGAPAGSDPHGLMERARAEARRREEEERAGVRLARRLFVAFLACLLIGVVCFVVVPELAGVHIPAWVPLLSFAAIAAGSLLTMPASEPKMESCLDDDARPIGCCPGPRPLRAPDRRG